MTDETDPGTPVEPAEPADAPAERRVDHRAGVSIPSWLAAALVVILGLGVGAAGFAIGRSTADGGDRQLVPIGAQLPGGGRSERGIPFGGPRGERGPGGEYGPGRGHERDSENDGRQSHGDTSEPAGPDQPGEQGAGF